MTPTQELTREHEAIKLMLEILGRMSDRLDAGRTVDPADLSSAVEFIQVFADKCHHAKEEGLLFPAMVEAGIPREGGPIGVMLAEHEAGRAFVRRMKAGVERYSAGDAASAGAISENARAFAALLGPHIHKEDFILYPLADRVLPAERQAALSREFERLEREIVGPGRHEAFHRLLESLEAAYLTGEGEGAGISAG